MGTNSKIEWCDHTFNPWIGCQKVSAGCRFCYAERDMGRKPRWANCWGPAETTERLKTNDAYWKQPLGWQREAEAAGKPALVFCASLADVFEDNPQVNVWRIELFEDLVLNTPWLKWLILTKRPRRAAEFFRNRPSLLSGNIWLGTSVEDQQRADERIPLLLDTPAAARFVSVEPMLGPVDFDFDSDVCHCGEYVSHHWENHAVVPMTDSYLCSLDWVIIGCESGPRRRPMQIEWALDLVRQCKVAGVPVFVKQLDIDGRVSKDPDEWPEELRVREYPGGGQWAIDHLTA